MAEDILDYYLPSDHESIGRGNENDLLSDYEFDFYAEMQFGGSEGIYIDCTLRGKFDDSGRTTLGVGTIVEINFSPLLPTLASKLHSAALFLLLPRKTLRWFASDVAANKLDSKAQQELE